MSSGADGAFLGAGLLAVTAVSTHQVLGATKDDTPDGAADSRVLKGSCGTPGEGPFAVAYLTVRGNRLQEVQFSTNGCFAAQLSARATSALLTGRTVEEAAGLTAEDLLVFLRGQIPEGKEDACRRAASAVQDALRSLLDR